MESTCIKCSCTPCMCNISTMCVGGLLNPSFTITTHPATTAHPQAAQGWECPRCRRINAPHAGQCTCVPGATFAPPYVPSPTTPPPSYPAPWWEGAQCFVTACALNGGSE